MTDSFDDLPTTGINLPDPDDRSDPPITDTGDEPPVVHPGINPNIPRTEPGPTALDDMLQQSGYVEQGGSQHQAQQVIQPPAEPVQSAEPTPQPNFTLKRKLFQEIPDASLPNLEQIVFPPASFKDMQDFLSRLPQIRPDTEENLSSWQKILIASQYSVLSEPTYCDSIRSSTRRWQQELPTESQPIRITNPAVNYKTQPKGEKVVLKLRSLRKQGGVRGIPLNHSGFWLYIRKPSERELIQLNEKIAMDKIELGNRTFGWSFGNHNVYATKHILDLVEDCIYETNLSEGLNWREHVKILDIPLIVWGLAAAVYPYGFLYSRPILNDVDEPTKINSGLVNVPEMFIQDDSKFTKAQLSHMAKRQGHWVTEEMMEIYQNGFGDKIRTKIIDENVSVNLRIPTAAEYETEGLMWVNEVRNLAMSVLVDGDNDQTRNARIDKIARSMSMSMFNSWVESIRLGGDESEPITERSDIGLLLEEMSGTDSDREAFEEGINKFKADRTNTIIAVNTADKEEDFSTDRWQYLFPVDPIAVFFILLDQKIQNIQSRPM